MREEHQACALEVCRQIHRQIRTEVSVLLARIENLFRYAMPCRPLG